MQRLESSDFAIMGLLRSEMRHGRGSIAQSALAERFVSRFDRPMDFLSGLARLALWNLIVRNEGKWRLTRQGVAMLKNEDPLRGVPQKEADI